MRKLLMILFIFCSLGLWAQEEWYIGKVIKDFSFVGLDTVQEAELKPIVRPYVGEEFSLEVFWEIQEKLYALEYFDSIESNALPGDEDLDSVIVEFQFDEKPVLTYLVVEGNRKIRKTEILETVLVKKGDMISQAQVNIDAEMVRMLYLEKGYQDTEVKGVLEIDEEDNSVAVTFKILEGFQTTIKTISFSGNDFVSESTLRKIMKTKVQALFSPGVFQESKFEEDLQRLSSYYGEHGFIDAKVEKIDRQIEEDEEKGKKYLVITIYISEGAQYTYSGMDFEGNVIFSDVELLELVRQQPGKILNTIRLEADFQRVADLYFENGYIFNVINRQENRDEKKQEIAYTVTIIEYDRAHIDNIIIKGNEKTIDYVILRELPFEEGDIFSKTKVVQGLRNLYNLQFFSTIAPETPQGGAEGLMDLVLNVEEGSTANINFGIVFTGGDYPISGTLKWEENNFLGRAKKIGVNLEISNLRQLLALSFEEPWLFGLRWAGGASLSLEHAIVPNIPQDSLPPIFFGTEVDAVPDPFTGTMVDPETGLPSSAEDAITDYAYAVSQGESIPSQYEMDYVAWKIGAGLNSGYRYFTPVGWMGVRGGISTSLNLLSYESLLYRPFDDGIRSNLDNWIMVHKLSTSVYWDKRDYFLNPSNGFYIGQGVTFAIGNLFGLEIGNRDYIRTDSTVEGFATLFDIPVGDTWSFKMVLAAHTSLHFILPQIGGLENTLTTDLLYIDGWNIARGWPLQKDKKALWDNRLELRIPISEQILWGILFFDGVAAYNETAAMQDMTLDDFYFGFGGGIRFTIPQFPIRLYLAKRFKSENGVLQWQDGNIPITENFSLDFVISLGGDLF
ncbi:MAG TPA: outer membrane protein assembly factor BamA [bacterium]|nr:outer membrane protein assembly factor BamA [bacterium]